MVSILFGLKVLNIRKASSAPIANNTPTNELHFPGKTYPKADPMPILSKMKSLTIEIWFKIDTVLIKMSMTLSQHIKFSPCYDSYAAMLLW